MTYRTLIPISGDVGSASISALLDSAFGTTSGSLLFRGAQAWALLSNPGDTTKFLNGAGIYSVPLGSALGTVTSVAMTGDGTIFNASVPGSPIIASGTLAPTLHTQTKNTFLAGSTSGSAAAPTFRAIAGADLPNPSASTLGGVESAAAVSHQWIASISTSGVPSLSQPAFSDISGSVAAAQLPNPSSSTLGGIESLAPVASKWINAISTSGVPSATQPAESDLSLTDITTNNVSTSQHGFAPKAPNDATQYLNGTGAYSVPAGQPVNCAPSASVTVPASYSLVVAHKFTVAASTKLSLGTNTIMRIL